MSEHIGQCCCGATRFEVRGLPLLRVFCHCTLCQVFNQAPFADVSLFRASQVELPEPELVDYRSLRPPPAVQRGRCKSCGGAAIETLVLPLIPRLVFIPSANLPRDCQRQPALHMFYHSRVADIDDGLPKRSGYLKSQLALAGKLLPALLKPAAKSA